jgi:soluble lytic murein transglycosylase-like protein
MSEIKTGRPYQERFLDGYDRHELRREVQKVKPSKRFSGLRKKTASWALGASLALGGIGIPLEMGRLEHAKTPDQTGGQTGGRTRARKLPGETVTPPTVPPKVATGPPPPTTTAIAQDLSTAQNIAREVTGGVTSAAQDVAQVAGEAPAAAAQAPADVVKAAAAIASNALELVRQHFFQTEVPFGQLIYQEAKRNALQPELLAAIVHAESKFVPTARSQAGAVGLMQLVPRTGRWLGVHDLTNPSQNVTAGAKYLRYLTDRFGGDTQKAVAAYNAGEGNVRRFGGIPPFRETRHYVSAVSDYQAELGQRIAGHDAAVLAR